MEPTQQEIFDGKSDRALAELTFRVPAAKIHRKEKVRELPNQPLRGSVHAREQLAIGEGEARDGRQSCGQPIPRGGPMRQNETVVAPCDQTLDASVHENSGSV